MYTEVYNGDVQDSPYTPGVTAVQLVGRDKALMDGRALFHQVKAKKFAGRLRTYVGPRGVGKTSLLRVLQSIATSEGFTTVWITAGEGSLIDDLLAGIESAATTLSDRAKAAIHAAIENVKLTLPGLEISASFDRSAKRQASLGRQLEELLLTVGREIAKKKDVAGLGIFIDEIQAADGASLRSLAYAWQNLQSVGKDLPLFCLSAGLSHTQDVITEYVSFGERFEYVHLANLTRTEAAHALEDPAGRLGVTWDFSALSQACDLARGYPYFIQLIGDKAWRHANYPEPGATITPAQITDAIADFTAERNNFFRARWMKATDTEIAIMTAMANLGDGPVRRRDVAKKLGWSTQRLSMPRQSLMDKGLVESPEWGYLSFTAPGFAQYVREISDAD